ncbi:MAG TPA: hypothetical protein VFK13_07235 [Gemmatimonadaceae bacterium]|nr:hypothetical protein [Gemmatimonadaceae bacterium]
MSRIGLCVMIALAALACAGSRRTTPHLPAPSVISADEVRRSGGRTAYEVIERVRSEFLYNRGPVTVLTTASPVPIVYLDHVRLGTLEQLRTIAAGDVAEIHLLTASEATLKYGTGHSGGAIEVYTRLQ